MIRLRRARGAHHHCIPGVLCAQVALFVSTFACVDHKTLQVTNTVLVDTTDLVATRTGTHDRLLVHYVDQGTIYGIEDHIVYQSSDGGQTFRELGRFAVPQNGIAAKLKNVVARNTLARMRRRNRGPSTMTVLNSGTILVFYDQIYRSEDGGQTFTGHLRFPEDAVDIFPHGIGQTPDDVVYFGEYDTSERPHPVRVFRGSNDGRVWEPIYTFPAGTIFHVHSITYDRFRNRLWIATGDRDDESALLYTDDEFVTIDTLGFGNQDWRIVSLTPTENYLYWGSDNDETGASIFRWSFASETKEELARIGKPSYYAGQLADGTLVITTTYEPDSPYTRNYHPEPTTDVWVSRSGTEWFKIFSAELRVQPAAWGIPRPVTVLPSGDRPEQLYFAAFNTTTWDFVTQRISLRWH